MDLGLLGLCVLLCAIALCFIIFTIVVCVILYKAKEDIIYSIVSSYNVQDNVIEKKEDIDPFDI
ncbi:MAG: hypothetical protein ACI4MQ_08765 [Candidatus Coproplasma sp.]